MPDKAKFPFPGDLLDLGIEPRSPILQADALTSAPPEKPLNTKIQSLRKPPIETQNFRSKYNIKDFKGGKEARLKKKGEEAGEGGQKGWPYRRLLPPTDTQALRDFSLAFQRREDWNSAPLEIRTRIQVLCQEEVISL